LLTPIPIPRFRSLMAATRDLVSKRFISYENLLYPINAVETFSTKYSRMSEMSRVAFKTGPISSFDGIYVG